MIAFFSLAIMPGQWSATYGLQAISSLPNKIIQPAALLQIVVTVWPA